MALIPPDFSSYISCEWRIFLSPACPYVSSLIIAYKTSLGLYSVFSVVMVTILAVRWSWMGHVLIRQGKQPWWLKVNPLEAVFAGTTFLVFVRVVQNVLLLYFTDISPVFVTNALYSIGHSVISAIVAYNWVVALPQNVIVDKDKNLPRIIRVSTKIGISLIFLLQPLPYLEGVSAIFTLTNQHLADQLLTASYTLWAIFHFFNAGSMLFFGRKLVKLLEASILFHGEASMVDKAILKQLRRTLATIKATILASTMGIGGGGVTTLIMALVRYYVWSSEGWSLALLFGFNFLSGICAMGICLYVFLPELVYRLKYGKPGKPGTREGSGSVRAVEMEERRRTNRSDEEA